MANLPRKPQAGDRTLQSMYDAICNIIDYLPSLEIRGDNKTIRINSYGKGKTIEAIQYATSIPNSGGEAVAPESPIPAIVSDGNREIGYTVTLYADGYDKASTGKGTAFLLQGNPQVQLVPVGTKIMVFPYKGMLDILG